MRRTLVAVVAMLALTGWAAAQARPPQPQQRDARGTAAAAPKGTAELAVLVSTDEQQSQPIRRVSVSIQAGELDVPHIGVSDDNGRVIFRDLVAGNYLLTASRAGYVKTFYGSSLPGRGPASP
jgi:hypothetical protein